jgi:outer membrane protein TolC
MKARLPSSRLRRVLQRQALPLAVAAALLSCSVAAWAQAAAASASTASSYASATAYPTELPPSALAISAIRQSPMVQAAIASLDAATAQRSALEAGPYEWSMRVGGQQRRVDGTTVATAPSSSTSSQRYREWSAALERPLRLPGKAALDGDIGAQGVVQAKAAHADALHETARFLLSSWFVWLRESDSARQWQRQAESLQKQRQATARRVELGDGARLELMQAEAAAAQAQAALEQARRRTAIATSELRARFPALSLPASAPEPGLPQQLDTATGQWREHLFEHNHELRLAHAGTQQARLIASRSDAERMPDPTIGVHVGSDRGGEERLTGISLTIPFPGAARAANAHRQTALAAVAAQHEASTLAKVQAEIASTLTTADTAWVAWQSAEDAALRLEQAATLTARARSLGEAPLTEVLFAQRQANEARLAANSARLDAQEARCRLLLDTHQLWAYGDEDEDGDEDGGNPAGAGAPAR